MHCCYRVQFLACKEHQLYRFQSSYDGSKLNMMIGDTIYRIADIGAINDRLSYFEFILCALLEVIGIISQLNFLTFAFIAVNLH